MRVVRGIGCARSVLRARADVRSELENEVRVEDHGHAGNKNGICGPVYVRFGRVRRGRTRVCPRKCADDRQCQTSEGAVAEQLRKHALTRSGQRRQHNRRERTGSWVRQVAQALEEQLKGDQQELDTREHQRRMEDAKRIHGIVHK